MARRSSLYGVAKSMARAARQAEAASRRMEREARRHERELEREIKRLEKEEKQLYLEERQLEAEEMSLELEETIEDLKNILEHTLEIDDTISFKSLRPKKPILAVPKELNTHSQKPQLEDYVNKVKDPSWLNKLFPGWEARYEKNLVKAHRAFEEADRIYSRKEEKRVSALQQLEKEHYIALKAYEQKNAEIDEFEKAYKEGELLAVESYNNMVLERSQYPESFPQEFRLVYIPESKELVIDYNFPDISVVPKTKEYKYIKSKDEIQEKPRKEKEIKELYQDMLMAIALRSIHEVFEADQSSHIDTVTFSGYIHTVDAATGQDIKPYLVSVRAIKEKFNGIELSKVDKKVCLRNLGAQVSPKASEVVAVKPVVEFNMFDKRFVDNQDFLSTLDSRPNLYELNPFEFENLICNLFEKMGFESRLTRSSKDGGVDSVAFDPRPILGGKVVIQAKRYKNTVGVSAVRDLWGTIDHERAHKGILITTSGYGPDAYKFAEDKPIELIDGGGLLYLLEQVGIQAKIQFPEECLTSV